MPLSSHIPLGIQDHAFSNLGPVFFRNLQCLDILKKHENMRQLEYLHPQIPLTLLLV
jgi:hypothetical protein